MSSTSTRFAPGLGRGALFLGLVAALVMLPSMRILGQGYQTPTAGAAADVRAATDTRILTLVGEAR